LASVTSSAETVGCTAARTRAYLAGAPPSQRALVFRMGSWSGRSREDFRGCPFLPGPRERAPERPAAPGPRHCHGHREWFAGERFREWTTDAEGSEDPQAPARAWSAFDGAVVGFRGRSGRMGGRATPMDGPELLAAERVAVGGHAWKACTRPNQGTRTVGAPLMRAAARSANRGRRPHRPIPG